MKLSIMTIVSSAFVCMSLVLFCCFRCMVKMNPERGSKAGKKKKVAIAPRVSMLINNMANFEWTE
jgi:hypothetical protein